MTNVVQCCPHMKSSDYGGRMGDSEVVAAIVAGDPEGLAKAYDKYAAPLYTYCRSLLHEPADAADAVQDTFVIAASRLDGLRDPERLRPWLYAVARNECRHRLRAKAATTALDEALDVTDEAADVGGDAERAELRALLVEAVHGLNPAEQEVIELQLRQGLDASEVADVLGISRNHAHALISRARDQLEICLGVLLVARTGREDCAELGTLLQDWDGHLTVLLRKRLHRHIERCPVCTDRRRTVLRPAMLLGLAPLAALAASATAPAGLRDRVLRLASSNRPDAVAHRAAVAGRTGAFGEHGFPKPLDPPKTHWWQARSAQAAAAVATVAVGVIVAASLTLASGGSRPPQAGSGAAGSVASTAPGPATTGGPGGRTGPGQPGASRQPGVSGQRGPSGGPGGGPSAAPGSSGPGATGQPSQGTQASSPAATSPVTSPGATTRATPSASKSPTPARSASTSPSPTRPAPSPSPTAAAAPGTVAASPTTVVLSALGPTTLTITASGGAVSWSVSEPSSLVGKVNFSPASGTLQAGQAAKVSITVDGLASIDSTLTVNPGGHTVTILLGVL
jgi:RNA polymerase sigma factor (sigma-70 family)